MDGIIDLEEGWEKIQGAINKLISYLESYDKTKNKTFTNPEYVEVYTIVYNMCAQNSPHNWSEELYSRHGQTIEKYLETSVLPALKEKRDIALLQEMYSRWKRHEIMDKWMRRIFMYLDRFHVKHQNVPGLHEASLEIFRRLVFSETVHPIVDAILVQINKEREGEVVDRDLLRQCVSVFGEMAESKAVYKESLEAPFLKASEEFYRVKSQDWINDDTLPQYLIKAESAINTERERVDHYLNVETKAKIIEVASRELLENHQMTLLEKEGSGCRSLLQDDKREDFARLFRLFQNTTDGLTPIANIVREHITKLGEEIVAKRESDVAAAATPKEKEALEPQFVQSLLDLHERYSSLITNEFNGHRYFQKALNEAFEVFVNHDMGKTSTAEVISGFCDRILKTGGAKLSDSEVESYLERCVQLFFYLSDKDLFNQVYRSQLAKRLLNNRSASIDAERSMIAKLKLACGAQYTSRAEGMLKDLLTGDDFKRAFVDTVRNEKDGLRNAKYPDLEISASLSGDLVNVGGIDFMPEVLTAGYWESFRQIEIVLPESMTRCIEVYKAFYDMRTDHRTLKWVYSLGTANVKAQFARDYSLQVATLQAVVLLAFNGTDDWVDFSDLVQRLSLDEEIAKRTLHSLSCSKHKVLTKKPMSRTIAKTDKFRVNTSFASPMRKLRIPMPSLEERTDPRKIDADRSAAIEAAIVRIMKARKVFGYSELVGEVLSQLHFFRPSIRVVKRRIEHLIDREYLERDPDQPGHYRYLA
mmetsp:Transcript_10011/g.17564  ORF Transcript_10011/g.17564 Transcript_10011/m.17564 type:complete len:759 (-) Transcript_10011:8-2284(-)